MPGWVISIHTPAKGVTASDGASNMLIRISIHTPAKGVTAFREWQNIAIKISIHTPAKGVTKDSAQTVIDNAFQSTLPRRE